MLPLVFSTSRYSSKQFVITFKLLLTDSRVYNQSTAIITIAVNISLYITKFYQYHIDNASYHNHGNNVYNLVLGIPSIPTD